MYSDICRVFDGGDRYHAPLDRAGRPANQAGTLINFFFETIIIFYFYIS